MQTETQANAELSAKLDILIDYLQTIHLLLSTPELGEFDHHHARALFEPAIHNSLELRRMVVARAA